MTNGKIMKRKKKFEAWIHCPYCHYSLVFLFNRQDTLKCKCGKKFTIKVSETDIRKSKILK